jgi:hypothetical protein
MPPYVRLRSYVVMHKLPLLSAIFLLATCASPAPAQLANLRIVTDASPDYHDMPALVHSITSRWQTPEQKCWAVFYWNHIARRQTNPMMLHGLALTDPIRQFNDYGYTMCSTISGINQSIWEHMNLPHRYWDISNHTVAEVFYDGRWHMYDSSLSALYTLCDGKTLAGVEDIGKTGSCAASHGKEEPGHVAKYHCLTATSPNGYLSGADTIRSLDEEYRCFNPNGLKLRTYFYDWDYGHRYVLNLRPGETYTRHYRSLGDTRDFYVPNEGKDPEKLNARYRLRGNGVWTFTPDLTPAGYQQTIHHATNIAPMPGTGLRAADPTRPAEATFKIQSANVTTSQKITLTFTRKTADDRIKLLVSTSNGVKWNEAWQADQTGERTTDIRLRDEVNGAYEVLLKFVINGAASLDRLTVTTTTNLNSKTQPRLHLGENTVHVSAGDQSDSIVLWPELQNGKYKDLIAEEHNVTSTREHPGYQGTVHPTVAKQDAWITYRIDAPRDLTRLTYGGRFFNRAPKSRIAMLHSFDDGKTWTQSYELTDTKQPWDVIHYETVAAPPGRRSALVKYLMNTTDPSQGGCSIYAVRIEANHQLADPTAKPVDVTFAWKEVQPDRSLVERSHTQRVDRLPATYTINVGGDDHPVMDSLTVSLASTRRDLKQGYSDGNDTGGAKFVGRWVTYGKNLAVGKPYTLSHPSQTSWEAGDPDGKKLTDGVAGPPYAGGVSYRSGAIWNPNTNPTITVDLGAPTSCATFGLNFHGYPFHDAMKGEVEDRVEVLVSDDGKNYRSLGLLQTNLRWRDLPVNHVWPDEETITGHTFRLIPTSPVTARFVRYRVVSPRHFCATEIEVLDSIRFEPFDTKIALPK